MIRTEETTRRYMLNGNESFPVTGLTADYSGRPLSLQVNYLEVQLGGDYTRVLLKGYKIKSNGVASAVIAKTSFLTSAKIDLPRWAAVWGQFPSDIINGLRDEDRSYLDAQYTVGMGLS